MRASHAVAVAGLLMLGTSFSAIGHAQNPSAESIIQSLKPSGGMTTRGIHPVGPAAGEPTTRGIHPVGPSAGPAAPSHRATRTHPTKRTAATSPAPEETAGAPKVNLTVQFRTGSAQLTQAARHTLDELGRALSSPTLAGYHFRIEGHTDTVGGAALNKRLSQERAESVVSYLEHKFAVAPDRLTAIGMGEEGLLVPTPPQTPEPRNRRVTVVNTGA